jgi:TATA-binding protein-associated factor Taf7
MMQQAITLQTTSNSFLITIDKKYIEQDVIFRLMNRIRLEYLVKTVDFDENIEILAEEIKSGWWENNKKRLLTKKDNNCMLH